ncbi:MAG: hypothetical protein K9I29_05870 [Bacteroidales bacterium]|nr:hypothetical protein [Bacteroidales bacterium]MCF8327804.1 hypothetical protein [Bacteroidales bacterium]
MKRFIVILLILIPVFTIAQDQDFSKISTDHIEFRHNGMYVLGGWAVTNILGSGYMMSQTNGWHFRFHQMNVFWNVVNLGIAAGGVGFTQSQDDITGLEAYEQYADFGKILLFNAGLDLAYMATGLFMQERAKNVSKRKDMLKGYGKSIILQGGFLFLFDAVLYGLNQSKMQEIFNAENIELSLTGNMMNFSLYF